MKRTDIVELFPEAPKETVDKLMAMNGADVNAAKTELEGLRRQLEEAKNSPELQEAQQKISQLQTELGDLKKAEALRLMREKVSSEKNVPANLLTGETEDACVAQADAILAFAKPSGYPVVRDGGDPHIQTQTQTRDKFAAWASENL